MSEMALSSEVKTCQLTMSSLVYVMTSQSGKEDLPRLL